MTAAVPTPEPPSPDRDDLEPAPEWVGDRVAAAKFGSPEAIRAALPVQQVAEFDAAYDAALSAARQTLRLDQLRHTLRVWRRIALMAEQDPDGHQQLLATIADVQRTGQPRPGSMPWTKLKTELGL